MKHIENKYDVENYGIEECRRMDAYEEDVKERKEKLLSEMIKKLPDLFKSINSAIKLNLNFEYEILKHRDGGKYIALKSEEIHNSVIDAAFRSFRIEEFNSGFYKKVNKPSYYGCEEDYSKPCPEVGYSISIHYQYECHRGGSNGVGIGWAYFTESHKEWKFELERDMR